MNLKQEESLVIASIMGTTSKKVASEDWDVDEEKRTGVSHGICPRCYGEMQAKLDQEK